MTLQHLDTNALLVAPHVNKPGQSLGWGKWLEISPHTHTHIRGPCSVFISGSILALISHKSLPSAHRPKHAQDTQINQINSSPLCPPLSLSLCVCVCVSSVHSGVIRWCSISEQQWYAKYLTNKQKRKTTSAKSARLPTPYSEHLTGVHAALVQAACYVDATHAVPAGRINRCRTAPRKTHSGTPMTQTGTASGAQRNLSRQVGP